jgi:hypothetical protein
MKDKIPPHVLTMVSSIVRTMPVGHPALDYPGVGEYHKRWMGILFEFIEPAPSPGRGKRQDRDEDMRVVFYEAGLAALGLPNDIERHVHSAFAELDRRVFDTIAEAIEAVKRTSIQNTVFSRHCFHALKAFEAVRLQREELGLEPEPYRPRVKAMVIEVMNGDHYLESNSPRWNEVWRKIGMPA